MDRNWRTAWGADDLLSVFKVCVSPVEMEEMEEVEEVEEVRTTEASAEWREDGAVM